MTRQTARFPLPLSVLAIVAIATFAGCAAGLGFGTLLGQTISVTAQAGDAVKHIS
jgi:hypothetical protein